MPTTAGGNVTAANAPVRRSRGADNRRTKADRSARARSIRPPRITWIAARISPTLANRRLGSGSSARVTICCSRGSAGGGARRPAFDRLAQLRRPVAQEDARAAEQLVQHDAEREDIRACVDPLGTPDLRRQVGQRRASARRHRPTPVASAPPTVRRRPTSRRLRRSPSPMARSIRDAARPRAGRLSSHAHTRALPRSRRQSSSPRPVRSASPRCCSRSSSRRRSSPRTRSTTM